MEKYSSWRDEGTGIPPFLPERTVPSSNLIQVIAKALQFAVVWVLSVIFTPFIGFDGSYQWKMKSLYSITEDVQVDGVKKRLVSKEKHFPKPGCLYIVNALCPFDALALKELANNKNCNFIVPRDGSLYLIGFKDWYQFAIGGGLWEDGHERLVKINDLETVCSGKVNYLFAEGTTSNGKSVLTFEISPKLLDEILEVCGLKVSCISLKLNSKITTPLKPKSTLKYSLGCISQGVRYKVRISETVSASQANVKKLRTILVGGDEYKLVGKKLDLKSKKKFSEVYYN